MQVIGRAAWEELSDELAELIIAGDYAPGERLVETSIAERFGISRGPVRSALSWLERRGLAIVRSSGGMVVPNMTAKDITEIYDVRIALECAALQRATSGGRLDLGALEQALKGIDEAVHHAQPGAPVKADLLAFHRELCELSGNQRLVSSWNDLSYQIRLLFASVAHDDIASVASDSHEHDQILDALRTPGSDIDPVRLLHRHLVMSRETLLDIVRSADLS